MENGISFYDDDGTKLDPETIPKPSLCLTCKKEELGGKEEMLYLLNRNDQRDESEFKCGAYESKL